MIQLLCVFLKFDYSASIFFGRPLHLEWAKVLILLHMFHYPVQVHFRSTGSSKGMLVAPYQGIVGKRQKCTTYDPSYFIRRKSENSVYCICVSTQLFNTHGG